MRTVLAIRLECRPELQCQQTECRRCQVCLNSVPDNGNGAADDRRDVGALDAEADTRGDGIGHTGLLGGLCHQVAQQVDGDDAHQQCHEHLPRRDAQCEKASGEHVAADAVHVRHPEREDVVPGPALLFQRSQILVRQLLVVADLDDALARRTMVLGGDLRVG